MNKNQGTCSTWPMQSLFQKFMATQSKLVIFFPSGNWQAADVSATYARSLGKAHRSTFFFGSCALWVSCSIPALQNPIYQPAGAPFISLGSETQKELLPIWGSFTCRPKKKWQFIISISPQMLFKSSLFLLDAAWVPWRSRLSVSKVNRQSDAPN